MQLVVLGLNHKTVAVDIREKFNINKDQILKGLHDLARYPEISEAVVLSTCNRTEIYAVVSKTPSAASTLKRFFLDLANCTYAEDNYFYYHVGQECIRHLFAVVSSLDSLVVGEGQILCQVKDAYSLALEAEATSTILNTLFHRAITTGKRVRTETRIAFNAVSVSYAAVQMALNHFGSLEGKSVLIYGAGQMAELTAKNLLGKGTKEIFVANRHIERAEELASSIGGTALNFRQALVKGTEADIVITSTGATHYIIKPLEAQVFMKHRHKPLVIIDIAVPRDVDPEIGHIENVHLYNIDDLAAVVENNIKERELEALKAQAIIEEEVSSLLSRFQYLSCQPVMERLTKKADIIRRRFLKRYMAKMDLSEEDSKVIEQMTHMIVRKLLRDPMTRLNQVSGTTEEAYYRKAITDLFKIDVLNEED